MAGTAKVGARVITADRQSMGKVTEVTGTGCFKTDARADWFGSNLIASVPGDEVRLSFAMPSTDYMQQTGSSETHNGIHTH
jgi:hypothetical protein